MTPLTYAKLLIVGVLLALNMWLYVGRTHARDALSAHLKADAAAELVRKDFIINTERAHNAALNAVDATLTREYSDALAAKDAVITDLRTGAVRVRDRFQCSGDRRLPGTSAPTIASDGPAEPGFTDQDAATALGIASDGDKAIVQLAACQAVVRGDRAP